MKEVLAIDPGLDGAFVYLNSAGDFEFNITPIIKNGKKRELDFEMIRKICCSKPNAHIFLERAVAFKMGVTGAFNYGRGFAMLEIAAQLSKLPTTYVMPAAWCKVMHTGISSELKAKEKSAIAVRRLYKGMLKHIPASKNGKLHEGIVDALLIAGYGLRQL